MLKKIIVIGGPTCSGKTEFSIELAERFGGEIVNFDSMCFYKYFDIGTAKPDAEERKRAVHHLIDIKYPDEEYNARMFSEDAEKLIDDIALRGKIPIFTGGTGLYIKALIYGLSPIPEIDKTVFREKASELIKEKGLPFLYETVKQTDPVYASKISPSDTQRITRAYEVYCATGKPLSFYINKNPFGKNRYDFLCFNLYPPKDYLKSCIMERTSAIIKKGLVEETKKILGMGYETGLKPFKGIGYMESLMYLNKELPSEKTLYDKIVSSTLKYAKRQFTFFKKFENALPVYFTDLNAKIEFSSKYIERFLE
jgi:tRNA dimethylallyltransferase